MSDFQEQLQYFKPSIPSSEITRDINLMNQLVQPNASIMANFSITDLTVDDFLSFQQLECQSGMAQNLPGTSHSNSLNELPIVYAITSTRDVFHESKKRKVMELSTSSSESISLAASGDDLKDNNSSTKKNSLRKGKKRSSEKERDKQGEVVHVRAKRGQATDTHSLAERFLSMELATACSSYNLILETGATEKAQGTNSLNQSHGMENLVRDRYGEQNCLHSTWPL
ncbi:transcription factor bee 3 [Quercus suber]|uniref:Transcription factor bee 3 n=1 Tax=Quercus suber TaxID=58331 RepID=A0AAW0IN78_QUESU